MFVAIHILRLLQGCRDISLEVLSMVEKGRGYGKAGGISRSGLSGVPSPGSFESAEGAEIGLFQFGKVLPLVALEPSATLNPRTVENLSDLASMLRTDKIPSWNASPRADTESLVIISPNISFIGIT